MRDRRVFIVGAIAVFLIFTVATVYPMLFPVVRWDIDCYSKSDGRKVWMPVSSRDLAEKLAASAEKTRGQTCVVTDVREPYRLYRDYIEPQ